MSRGFGATKGSATTDICTLGSFSLAATCSISFWARRNGAGGSNAGRILSSTSPETDQIIYDGAGNKWSIVRDFSTTDGNWTVAAGTSTATWYHVLVTFANSTAAPVIYLDGVSQTVTQVTAAVGTPVVSSKSRTLGNRPSDSARGFDGEIAEFALYSATLDANDAKSLAAGVSPLVIKAASLDQYFPLRGRGSTEPSAVAQISATLTGTAYQSHPPRVRGMGRVQAGKVGAAGANNTIAVQSGSLTLTGYAPTLVLGGNQTIQVPAGALALTGYAPVVNNGVGTVVDVPSGDLLLTAHAPTVWNYPRIVTPSPLKNNTATAWANETGATCFVHNVSTGALVVKKTSLSTDASGNMAFQDSSLSPATSYRCIFRLASGAEGLATITTT